MKNVQIGDNDLYGHRFNGHDLHNYLLKRGIESKHLVWVKRTNDINTFEIADHLTDRVRLNETLSHLENKLALQAILLPLSYQLLFNKYFLDADIAHYHLIHNHFFSISLLPVLSRLKPTVWTVHDFWAMTGHCVYPFNCERWKTGCGDCPNLDTHIPIGRDTSAINWEIKKTHFENSDIDIIVASRFMLGIAQQSPILSKFQLHHIPFGIDLELFKPKDNAWAKKELGISPNQIVLSFRAFESPFKGLAYIRDTLRRLNSSKPVCLLTFNEKGRMEEFRGKFQVLDLGWVSDDERMITAYNATDIFLMPSTQEAFGMMAMEAMACAKPVIVMDGTSLSEIVFAPEAGISIPQADTDALRSVTERLIENEEERKKIGEKAREYACKFYNIESYINSMIELYEDVVERRKISPHYLQIAEQLKNIASKEDAPSDVLENVPSLPVAGVPYEITYLMTKLSKHKMIKKMYKKILQPMVRKMLSERNLNI